MVDFSIYNRDDDSLADIDYMGHGRDGGYAEYQTVPAENAHVVDTNMSDVELATFCCAYLTGEQMLERAGLKAGERVLVTGASGGVGSGIVQLARARGAIPYAVVGKGKEQAVLDIGAEAVITRGVADLPQAVAEATGGKPIDVVADLVGGAIFNDLLRILRPEGRYTTAGAIAGPVVQLDLQDHVSEAAAAAWLEPGHARRFPPHRWLHRGEEDPAAGRRRLQALRFPPRAGGFHRQGFRRQAGGGAGRHVGKRTRFLSQTGYGHRLIVTVGVGSIQPRWAALNSLPSKSRFVGVGEHVEFLIKAGRLRPVDFS